MSRYLYRVRGILAGVCLCMMVLTPNIAYANVPGEEVAGGGGTEGASPDTDRGNGTGGQEPDTAGENGTGGQEPDTAGENGGGGLSPEAAGTVAGDSKPETATGGTMPDGTKDVSKSERGSSDTNGNNQKKAASYDDPVQSGDLEIIDYEITKNSSSKKDKTDIRKGDRVKIVIKVRSGSLMTGTVGKDGVKVTKLLDSFRMKGNIKVQVTSKNDELLNFKITMTDLVYSGSGDSLRYSVHYTRLGTKDENMELGVSESLERYGSEGDDESRGEPMVYVKLGPVETPVRAGEIFTLSLFFENLNSEVEVENLIASFDPGDSMALLDSPNYHVIDNLNGKGTEIRLKLQAGPELSGISQTLGVDMKFDYYRGSQKNQGSASQKILIPIKTSSQAGQPMIRITRNEIKSPIEAGQKFMVSLNIENLSQDKAIQNLVAGIEPSDKIFLMDSTDSSVIGEMKPGQVSTIQVTLQAGDDLTTVSQLIGVNLKFDYDSGKGITQGTFGQKIVIPTNGNSLKAIGSPTPNIIIKKYNYGNQVAMGAVFDLDLEFVNTSTVIPIENIVMSMDTGEGLSITSSSNTFYLSRMEPGVSHNEKIKVQALAQTKLDSPKITFSFKYEYIDKKERKQGTGTETIAIPVYQPDRFSVRNPDLKDAVHQNEEITISIPYVNKGKAEISNVEAKLEGDIEVLERQLNLGNFEAGKSGTIDFIVTPKEVGEVDANVTITYENAAMKVQTVKVPIHLKVEAQEIADHTMDMEAAPSGFGGWWIWLTAGVAGIAGAGLVIRRKKGKKKQEMEEESVYETDWDDQENHERRSEEEAEVAQEGAEDEK